MISTLRGGNSRYLPLIMAKIRDELPSIATHLPSAVVSQIATLPHLNGASYGPLGGINGRVGGMGWNAVNGGAINGMSMRFGGDAYIKPELHSGSSASVSEASTPFGTPPVMHYFPLSPH